MIGRLILLNEEIGKTTGIKDSVENSHRGRKREDLSDDRMMPKSGVKFTAQQDMIWKSVKLFWFAKRCHHHHHWRRKSPGEAIIVGKIPMISIIFGGSMSITSKTQGKKLQREISLAQRIEPRRRIRWFEVDISFGPEDHPITELSDRNLPFVVKIPIG
jgi:hypothetical protein